MKTTFRAMQIAAPGVLELVEHPLCAPGADEVLVKVDVCGVCGADIRDSERPRPDNELPRISGHEIVGHIVSLGEGVPARWHGGQRVGISRLGGYCQQCEPCRRGQFHLCEDQLTPGVSCDGGYAEYVLMRHTALIAIPDELSSVNAAPVLCAGTATFNALRKSGAKAGDRVAILGVGGLGHMAIQYARRMGLEVIVIGRGNEKKAAALQLGGHQYIDSARDDMVSSLKDAGGVNVIIATAPDSDTISSLLPALSPQGSVMLLGTGKTPLTIMPGMMIGGERRITGSYVSTPAETEDALRFSTLFDVLPVTELMPFEAANEALKKLKTGNVRYRIVLTMNGKHSDNDH